MPLLPVSPLVNTMLVNCGANGGPNVEATGVAAVDGGNPLTSNEELPRNAFFWLVALKTLRVICSRFLAAAAAETEPPLVRGNEELDEDDEAPPTPVVVAAAADAAEAPDGAADRRFRNSASFAARA